MYSSVYSENSGYFLNTANKPPNDTPDAQSSTQAIHEKSLKLTGSIDVCENIMNRINIGNNFKAFLVGNNMGTLKYQMVQIRGLRYSLNSLVLDITDDSLKQKISDQLKETGKKQTDIDNFITKQENEFSVFGWFVALI